MMTTAQTLRKKKMIKEAVKKRHIRAVTKDEEKSFSTTSWTFFYHKPYQTDWKEAKYQARGKKWKGLP